MVLFVLTRIVIGALVALGVVGAGITVAYLWITITQPVVTTSRPLSIHRTLLRDADVSSYRRAAPQLRAYSHDAKRAVQRALRRERIALCQERLDLQREHLKTLQSQWQGMHCQTCGVLLGTYDLQQGHHTCVKCLYKHGITDITIYRMG
jgi:hypothetical protein